MIKLEDLSSEEIIKLYDNIIEISYNYTVRCSNGRYRTVSSSTCYCTDTYCWYGGYGGNPIEWSACQEYSGRYICRYCSTGSRSSC